MYKDLSQLERPERLVTSFNDAVRLAKEAISAYRSRYTVEAINDMFSI